MRFMIDQDVFAVTTRFLRDNGHDAVTASELGLSRSLDSELLRRARTEQRIFVTRDRDYGRLVFVDDLGPGVIFLRMIPTNSHIVHQELAHVLATYSEAELLKTFVVVEPARHRVRRTAK